MKRFLTEVVIYSIAVLLAGNVIIYCCLKIWPLEILGEPLENIAWNHVKHEIGVKNLRHKNIVLGDSRSMAAINPNIVKHNFVNFSLGGSSSFEGFLILKRYLKINKVDTLIVSYGAYPLTIYQRQWFEEKSLAFDFADFEDVNGLERVEKKYNRTIDNETPNSYTNIRRMLYQIRFPYLFRSKFVERVASVFQKDSDFVKKETRIKAELDEENGHTLFGRLDSSNQMAYEVTDIKNLGYFDINPVCLSYLDSIYLLSCKENIKVIFVTTPFNYSTYKKLSDTKFYSGYNRFIDSLKIRYPKISILAKYPFLPNVFFGDGNHLNRRGSDFFSEYLCNELNGLNN